MRKLLVLLCAVVVSLAVVGCGSSGSSDGVSSSTTTTVSDSEGDLEGEYLRALQANLTSGSMDDQNLVIADDEATCVAPKWIEAATVETFVTAGISPQDASDPGFEFSMLELDETQAQAMIDAFEPCGVDIYAKLAESFTAGLTEAQQSCAMASVDPAIANALLVTAFSTSAGSGDAEFEALVVQLTDACDLPRR